VGAPVKVRFDAIPNLEVDGVVAKIAEMSAITLGEVVYKVTVQLEETTGLPLRWGMTAHVSFDKED
jgi:hypothetical protein